ncbi:MAG: hypothetical protein EXQ94_12765 [Alphaproteobacteria bacterium]|nr:hypothetical protein [Alphaproteobacteria bacterium]
MSNVYAKSVQGCVIDAEHAYELASNNVHKANYAERRRQRRTGRLSSLLLALALSGFASAMGFVVGPALAGSAFGLAVSNLLSPVVSLAVNASAIEYLIAGAFFAMVGLVCYVRG